MDSIKINSGSVKMIAHRGLSGIERENTCPAFLAAATRSYFGIETDVHKTKDGKFVIIHDETTERITNGAININVEESNYEDIKSIVLPDLDGSTVRQDIHIPLLCEYIQICKKYEKICVLELKNPFDEADIEKIINEIKELDYLHGVIFISFSFANCLYVRKYAPDNEIQYLFEKMPNEDRISKMVKNKVDVDAHYNALTEENINYFHSLGMKINCWTCDNEKIAARLISWGVDFITSNILE